MRGNEHPIEHLFFTPIYQLFKHGYAEDNIHPLYIEYSIQDEKRVFTFQEQVRETFEKGFVGITRIWSDIFFSDGKYQNSPLFVSSL